ncbi:uncharacterized protein METZ01_LOCUS349996, partial [marine metagenome]
DFKKMGFRFIAFVADSFALSSYYKHALKLFHS